MRLVNVLWALFAAAFCWFVIGCGVLAAIDDDRSTLFKWARSAPNQALYVGAVMLWPLVVYLWRRGH